MDDAAAPSFLLASRGGDALDAAIDGAATALLRRQRPDGHWVFELEADATIPAEYILLVHYLGETPDLELERKIGVYLRRIQGEHGGWPLFHGGDLDVSATVKAYFALKMIGDDIDAPLMARAREALLARGGAGACNVFTRYLLAMFGMIGWRAVPQTPVEIMLLPRWFPVHLSKISYWARTVVVPLLVLRTLKTRARNPRGVRIDELFIGDPAALHGLPKGAHQKQPWAFLFGVLDRVLVAVEPFWPKGSRRRAIARAEAFVTERLNGEDGLGAIFPAMANSVMMYDALGYPPEHPLRATARGSIDKLLIVKDDEAYCQPCFSPVWDTALAAHALLETQTPDADAAVSRGLEWLKPLQVLDVAGDWAEVRPDVRPGGWAFQYRNDHYPDLDDTAVVAMAMDRADGRVGRYGEAIARGREWVEGLQSKNGGWGAFDADNTYHYLNNIPFADHGALLDPPTADVAARCISLLAQLGEGPDSPRVRSALDYLRREQMADGSWFGPLGGQLRLWNLVRPLRAQCRRSCPQGSDDHARRRLADRYPEPRRWLGRRLRQLQARLRGLRTRAKRLVTDQLGAAGPNGRRAGGRSGRRPRRRLAHRPSGCERRMAGRHLHRGRLPPRLLPPLPRLFEDLPALGAGAVPQPGAR